MSLSVPERYPSWPRYWAAWGSRAALRTLLRTTIGWRSIERPKEGYSVVVGVPWLLWDLVQIPLLSLQRARRDRCVEVILAVDATEKKMKARYGEEAIERIARNFPDLPVRILYYTPWQQLIAGMIGWNWVDCWLTWAMGLAETTTRHALLHDFDAVVVDPEFLERHYDIARGPGTVFTGIAREMTFAEPNVREVLMTIELLVDVQHLRSRYSPVELFNRVRLYRGRRMECDILRDMQLREPASAAKFHELREGQIVHPSQVVSQWRELQGSSDAFTPVGYTPLFVIPYFRHVGGDAAALPRITQALADARDTIKLEGKYLNLAKLNQNGLAWAANQIEDLDRYFSGAVTEPVKQYCEQIRGVNLLKPSGF